MSRAEARRPQRTTNGRELSYEADVSARREREREAEMADARHLHPGTAVHSPAPPDEDGQASLC